MPDEDDLYNHGINLNYSFAGNSHDSGIFLVIQAHINHSGFFNFYGVAWVDLSHLPRREGGPQSFQLLQPARGYYMLLIVPQR